MHVGLGKGMYRTMWKWKREVMSDFWVSWVIEGTHTNAIGIVP